MKDHANSFRAVFAAIDAAEAEARAGTVFVRSLIPGLEDLTLGMEEKGLRAMALVRVREYILKQGIGYKRTNAIMKALVSNYAEAVKRVGHNRACWEVCLPSVRVDPDFSGALYGVMHAGEIRRIMLGAEEAL